MTHLVDAALINSRVSRRLKNPRLSGHALREIATMLTFEQYRIELAFADLDVQSHGLRRDLLPLDRALSAMNEAVQALHALAQTASVAELRIGVKAAHENASVVLALLEAEVRAGEQG
ncbi:MAG TPA: hypothetical protein VF898_02675 [Chloroflexota bacterium]